MKLISAIILLVVSISICGCSSNVNPNVKKSSSGICHQNGTNYYNKTKNFTAYNSIEECLKSGGRMPLK